MSFDSLGLSAELLRAVTELGYTQPTPIQARGIAPVLEGRDLLAAAQTGTGKTAAFALPLLQMLSNAEPRPRGSRAPRCLVLVPTRELAAQVQQSIADFGRHLEQRTTLIFGGVSPRPQIDALRQGADIVVATPGRLLDHANERNINLRSIRHLVLDEADRMLDMGFIRDIRRVLALLPRNARTCCSPRRFRRKSGPWPLACCTTRSRSKSRRAMRRPNSSSTACTWWRRARSARC